MNTTLSLLEKELDAIRSTITSTMPNNEPLSLAHGNWSFPGVTRDDLISYSTSIINLIQSKQDIFITEKETIVADFIRRLVFLRSNTIPQFWNSNAALAIAAYISTMTSLKNLLDTSFESNEYEKINLKIAEANETLKTISKPLRAIEARLLDINTRSINLDEKVISIEQAHETANQLPTDLESLSDSRKKLEKLLKSSESDQVEINKIFTKVLEIQGLIESKNNEATAIINRCDEAYRAMTSQGLASAFEKKSRNLSFSMWVWVVGLIISLGLGFFIGSNQLHSLASSINNVTNNHTNEVLIDLVLTILSIGAPIWFAWLATKQIGQRFRLAEDYGYKSTISTAYEGYRREAEFLDPSFQTKLFSSALSRLDEIPLRLIETDSHGSPWHELASSNSVKEALKVIPEFAETVTNLAKDMLSKVKQ